MFFRKQIQKEIAKELIAETFLFNLKTQKDFHYVKGLCQMAKVLDLITEDEYVEYIADAENKVYCAAQARQVIAQVKAQERKERAARAKNA